MSTSPSIQVPGLPTTGGTISGGLVVAGSSGLGVTGGILLYEAGSNTYFTANAETTVPSFANGTALQLSSAVDYMVYLTCTTAGTAFTLGIGNSVSASNLIANSIAVAVGDCFSFRLPAGWYAKWSATSAAFADQLAIGC